MAGLKVREFSPFGAEIEGIVPQVPLDDETCRRLRQVFNERSILLFRDLAIDQDFQKYLAHMLVGREAPTAEPDAGSEPDEYGQPRRREMLISNKEDGGAAPYGRLLFHCDTMWSETWCESLALYGVDVEQPNAPTLFANMVRGWDTLPEELKARVEDRQAKHGHDDTYPNRGGDDDVIDAVFTEAKSVTRDVALRHPRTGRTSLYLSQQVTQEIVGLSPEENEDLLEKLFAHLYAPENVYAHEWRTGDLVVWDNQALQHARSNVDLDGPTRTLRKVFAPTPERINQGAMPTFSKVAQG